jgi:hypothetical protein
VGQSKLAKAVGEFSGYLTADTGRIPYHGERYHAGEVISTSFVEFAVNQVVSKRMVKKQQTGDTPQTPTKEYRPLNQRSLIRDRDPAHLRAVGRAPHLSSPSGCWAPQPTVVRSSG